MTLLDIIASFPKWQLLAIGLGPWALLEFQRGIYRVLTSPFPGPTIAKFTQWWIRWKQVTGTERSEILHLHQKYGPTVQVGPREVSFCHADALHQIYGGPKGLDASEALLAFQNYGSQNLVSTLDADLHAARRKMIAGLYSGPTVESPAFQAVFEEYIEQFMNVIEEKAKASPNRVVDVSSWIRWLVGDIIIHHVYGKRGHPNFLTNETSRKEYQELQTTLMGAIAAPVAIFFGWFPRLSARIESLLGPDMIGAFGKKRVEESLLRLGDSDNVSVSHLESLRGRLGKEGRSNVLPGSGFIASDCLDNFVAGRFCPVQILSLFSNRVKGYFTTADLIAALLWELSLPENQVHQTRLRQELHEAEVLPGSYPQHMVVKKLLFLDCVLRETLRVHVPIPFGLPRTVKKGQNIVVFGHEIPAGTTIHSSAYCLHRDADAFPDPEKWNPERWTASSSSPEMRHMNRMFWPFGSGARMCTGRNLAMAELRLITARIYSTYQTLLDEKFLDKKGCLVSENDRKAYYPFKMAQPIRFLNIQRSV